MMRYTGINRRRFLIQAAMGAIVSSFDIKNGRAESTAGSPLSGTQKIVVIGSGIGGMASAALFAQAGHEVIVLEMNSLIGGHARHLERQNLKYSCGPQYVWNFQEGEIGDRFLKRLAIDQTNPFESMDKNGFETIFLGQNTGDTLRFEVPMGLARFADALQRAFPQESTAIGECFDDIIAVSAGFRAFTRLYALESVATASWNLFARMDLAWRTKAKMFKAAFCTLEEWFDSYQLSPNIRRICYGHGGIFVENESSISALIYILATSNYHRGASFPRHGFYTLFDSMKKLIEEKGGKVLTNKKVVKIDCKEQKAVQVNCADGSKFSVDFIISNISPRLTANLLSPELQVPFSYDLGPSIIICLLAIRGQNTKIAQLRGRNYWWLDGKGETNYLDIDLQALPSMLYIASHTACGFGRFIDDPDLDSLTIFAAGNYPREKNLLDSGLARHEEYRQRKMEQIISILDGSVFKGIAQSIVYKELVTASDLVRDTDSELGNIYGKRISVRELHKGIIPPLPVANLANVSATQHAAGIAAGIATAADLFRKMTNIEI